MNGTELEERKRTLAEQLKAHAQTLKELKLEEACVILVDVSGSMSEPANGESQVSKLEAVKQAIPNLRVAGHRVVYGLVAFSDRAEVIQPLTSNFGLIIAQQEILHVIHSTNITAAIREGIELVIFKQVEKKRMILLSDGCANVEKEWLDEQVTRCRECQVIVDTIGFGVNADERRLKDIATQTGGVYYSARTAKNLQEVYAKLNYTVRYIEHKGGDTK